MLFWPFNRVLSHRTCPPGIEEWNAYREQKVVAAPPQKSERERCQEAISSQHWVTLVCFVEKIDPASLCLESRFEQRVQSELAVLAGFDPLQAYVTALEYLSSETFPHRAVSELSNDPDCKSH